VPRFQGFVKQSLAHPLRLPIKRGYRPFKQPPRKYNQKVLGKVKVEVE
jgi:hypothetical protein